MKLTTDGKGGRGNVLSERNFHILRNRIPFRRGLRPRVQTQKPDRLIFFCGGNLLPAR